MEEGDVLCEGVDALVDALRGTKTMNGTLSGKKKASQKTKDQPPRSKHFLLGHFKLCNNIIAKIIDPCFI